MEPPGRCGDWLAPPPSPPRAHAPGRHDERGVGTFNWATSGDLHLTISGDFREVAWFQGLTAFLQPAKVVTPYNRTAF